MSLPSNNPVTAWYRFDKEHDVFGFNHLEDGHSTAASPEDKLLGKRWKNGVWERRHGALVPGGAMGAPRLQLNEAPPAVAPPAED
jgi:hypothetical protein